MSKYNTLYDVFKNDEKKVFNKDVLDKGTNIYNQNSFTNVKMIDDKFAQGFVLDGNKRFFGTMKINNQACSLSCTCGKYSVCEHNVALFLKLKSMYAKEKEVEKDIVLTDNVYEYLISACDDDFVLNSKNVNVFSMRFNNVLTNLENFYQNNDAIKFTKGLFDVYLVLYKINGNLINSTYRKYFSVIRKYHCDYSVLKLDLYVDLIKQEKDKKVLNIFISFLMDLINNFNLELLEKNEYFDPLDRTLNYLIETKKFNFNYSISQDRTIIVSKYAETIKKVLELVIEQKETLKSTLLDLKDIYPIDRFLTYYCYKTDDIKYLIELFKKGSFDSFSSYIYALKALYKNEKILLAQEVLNVCLNSFVLNTSSYNLIYNAAMLYNGGDNVLDDVAYLLLTTMITRHEEMELKSFVEDKPEYKIFYDCYKDVDELNIYKKKYEELRSPIPAIILFALTLREISNYNSNYSQNVNNAKLYVYRLKSTMYGDIYINQILQVIQEEHEFYLNSYAFKNYLIDILGGIK